MTYFPDISPDELPYTVPQFRAAMTRLLKLSEPELTARRAAQCLKISKAVTTAAQGREKLWRELDYIDQALGIKQLMNAG